MHFLLDKNSFRRNFVLLTGHHTTPVVTLFLVLPMLLVWHYTIQWLSGTAPVLLTKSYTTPVVAWWFTMSNTNLKVCFLLSRVFYLTFLPGFSRPLGRQFNLKVSRAACWSLKQSPSPTICLNHRNPPKIVCGRFCSWARTGH